MTQQTSHGSSGKSGRLLPFAFGGGLLLVVCGYALLFALMRTPKSAGAAQMRINPKGPVAMIPSSVASGFVLEEFATEAEANRADELQEQSGVLSQRQRLKNTVAEQGGAIEIGLMWEGTSDIDLSVAEPNGARIAADKPPSPNGRIDVDANPSPLTREGSHRESQGWVVGLENMAQLPDWKFDGTIEPAPSDGTRPQSLWSKQPIEHIAFRTPPAGTYTVFVHCYGWREASARPLPVTVEIRSKDKLIARLKGAVGPTCYLSARLTPMPVMRFEVR